MAFQFPDSALSPGQEQTATQAFQFPPEAKDPAPAFAFPPEADRATQLVAGVQTKSAEQLAQDHSFKPVQVNDEVGHVLSPEQKDKLVEAYRMKHDQGLTVGGAVGGLGEAWEGLKTFSKGLFYELPKHLFNLAPVPVAYNAAKNGLRQAGKDLYKNAAEVADAVETAGVGAGQTVRGLVRNAVNQEGTRLIDNTLGTNAAEATGVPKERFNADITRPSEFFKPVDWHQRLDDETEAMRASKQASEGGGYWAKALGLDKETAEKMGVKLDPEAIQALAPVVDPINVAAFALPLLKGLQVARAAEGGYQIVNASGKVLANTVSKEAAENFVKSAGEKVAAVGEKLTSLSEKASLANAGVLGEVASHALGAGTLGKGAAIATAAKLGTKATGKLVTYFGETLANPAVSLPVLEYAAQGVKGGLTGAAFTLPFAAGADTPDEGLVSLESGALLGATGAAAGHTLQLGATQVARGLEKNVGSLYRKAAATPQADVAAYGTDSALDKAHSDALNILKQKDPTLANSVIAARRLLTALDNDGKQTELYLLPTEVYNSFFHQPEDGSALPKKAASSGVTPTWEITRKDGKTVRQAFLPVDFSDADAIFHEPGHLIRWVLPEEIASKFDAATDKNLGHLYEHFWNVKYAPRAKGMALPKVGTVGWTKYVREEVQAELLSSIVRGVPLEGVDPKFRQQVASLVAGFGETSGLYRLGLGENDTPSTTPMGIKISPNALAPAESWVRQRIGEMGQPQIAKPPVIEQPPVIQLQPKTTTEELGSVVKARPEPGLATESTAAPAPAQEQNVSAPVVKPVAQQRLSQAQLGDAQMQLGEVKTVAELRQLRQAWEESPDDPRQQHMLELIEKRINDLQDERGRQLSGETATAPNLRGKGEADYRKFQGESRAPANARVSEVQAAVEANKDLAPEQKQAVQTLLSNLRTPHDVVYNAAKNEAGSMERAPRRADVEAARNNPALRDVASKLASIPLDARTLKNGDVQLQFWSGDKVLSNYETLANDPKAAPLIPFKDSAELAADLQTYTANQDNGYRGDGEKLNRPANPAGFIPDENPDYTPVKLSKEKSNFLNLLMGEDPPETVRANKGTVPIQVRAKQIASLNDHAGIEVKPRKAYKDYPNVAISDYNPLRVELQKAGVDTSKLTEAHEWVNAKEIKSATPRPDIKLSPTSTDVTAAGFMPAKGEAKPELNEEDARRIVHSTLENGGATFDPRTGKFAGADEDSYVVSIYPERTKILNGDPTKQQLAEFLKTNSDLLSKPGNSLGTWRNDGKTYVDVVVSTADRQLAQLLGKRYNQKAIWDSRKGEEIPTGGTGEPVKVKIPETARLAHAQDELGMTAFMPSKDPRAVKLAAVRDEETGKVYEGPMHAVATLEALADRAGVKADEDGNYPDRLTLDAWNTHPYLKEGFTTHSGEFLDRDQALARAVELKQYKPRDIDYATGGMESQAFAKQQSADAPINEGKAAQQFMPGKGDDKLGIDPDEIRAAVKRNINFADKGAKQVELRRNRNQQETPAYRGDMLGSSHADGYAQELQMELSEPRSLEELQSKHEWLQKQIDRAEESVKSGSTESARTDLLAQVESLRGQQSAVERLLRRKSGLAQQFMPSRMPDVDKEDLWKDTDWSKYEVKSKAAPSNVEVRRKGISKANQAHSVGEKIKAIHFSGAGEGIKEIDPAFMKLNSTGASWEPNPKRSFFYVEGSEVGNDAKKFGNRTAYAATIEGKRIYDATGKDPLGFFKDWPTKANDKAVVKAGFDGVMMSAENGTRKIVMMYQKTPVEMIGHTDAEGRMRLDERVATQFMPAKGVDLKDYIGKPLFVLTTDRMGVGHMEVGPTGAKQPIEVAGQGGRGFMHIYKDGGWAFSDEGSAKRFLTRVRQVAGDGDSAIAALAVLSPVNHMRSPTGQLAYWKALNAAVEAGAVSKKIADAQIKEIFSRLAASKDKKLTQDNRDLFAKVKTLEQFGEAARNKTFNFEAAKHMEPRLAGRKLPIPHKELVKLGIDFDSIARDIADPGLRDLPNYSLVGLVHIPKDQVQQKTDFHFSYPWTVEGKALGFMKGEHNVADLTSDQSIYQTHGNIGAQPLQTVMPKLDKMEQLALQFMPAKDAAPAEKSLADGLRQKVRRARLVTADDAAKALGEYPKYLNGVVSFLGDRREALKKGEVTKRDLAKAYAITVASQGSDSIRLSKLQESVPGFNPDKSFLSGDKIRPEEAAAWWLGTGEGQKALDGLDSGKYDAKDWEGLQKVRKAYGDDRIFYSGILMKPGEVAERPVFETEKSSRAVIKDEQGNPIPTGRVRRLTMTEGQHSMANLDNVLQAINDAKGDGAKLMEAVQQLRGIGPAKAPFISHILGFGGDLTLDAVEINYWLTGKSNIKHAPEPQKAFVDAVKHDEGSQQILKDRIVKRLMEVREKLPEAKAIPEEAYLHVMHHWLWDKAKGSETTHEGVYKAAQQFMPKRTESFSPADIKPSRRSVDWSQVKIGRRDDRQEQPKALSE